MAINLRGPGGFVIFVIILIFFQFFFGLIGSLVSNFIGLTGLLWWVMTIGILLIFDAIFVTIN